MKKVLLVLCAVSTANLSLAAGLHDTLKANTAPQDSTKAVAHASDSTQVKKVAEGPHLDFAGKTEIDFGKIKEKGGKQVREFTFKNSGNRPLIVTKTMVSCRCVDVSCPKKPVLPGGKGQITVTYNPRKQSGVFHKAIQVYSNDPQTRHIIFVKGEVVE